MTTFRSSSAACRSTRRFPCARGNSAADPWRSTTYPTVLRSPPCATTTPFPPFPRLRDLAVTSPTSPTSLALPHAPTNLTLPLLRHRFPLPLAVPAETSILPVSGDHDDHIIEGQRVLLATDNSPPSPPQILSTGLEELSLELLGLLARLLLLNGL